MSIKNYRPFKHTGTVDQAGPDEYYDRKHHSYQDKPVNIHRVINLKKQYRQQV